MEKEFLEFRNLVESYFHTATEFKKFAMLFDDSGSDLPTDSDYQIFDSLNKKALNIESKILESIFKHKEEILEHRV
jgi:hypothetical protein